MLTIYSFLRGDFRFRSVLALALALALTAPGFSTIPSLGNQEAKADPLVFYVTSTEDGHDATPGDGVCASTDAGNPCTLRAALEEVNALGGENTIIITVTGTTIPLSALPDISTPFITIIGPGSDQFVIDGTLTTGVDGLKVQASDVTISRITVTNFGANGIFCDVDNGCSTSTFDGNHITANGEDGILAWQTINDETDKNITVSNSTIDHNGYSGIEVTQVNSTNLLNNSITYNNAKYDQHDPSTTNLAGAILAYGAGARVSNTIVDYNRHEGLSIHNFASACVEDSTFSYSGHDDGILIGGNSHYITITNCTASFNATDGVWLMGDDTDNVSSYITLSGGKFYGNGHSGIAAANYSENVTISSVAAYDNGGYGISLLEYTRYINVSNGTIFNNASAGIGSTASSNDSIQNNTISSNFWHGIFLQYSTLTTIQDNIVNSNGSHGVILDSSTNITISSNTVSSNAQSGVSVSNTTSSSVDNNIFNSNGVGGINAGVNVSNGSNNNTISNNALDDNGLGVIIGGDGTSSNAITSNTINNTASYFGILVWQSANNNALTGNSIDTTPAGMSCIQVLTDGNAISGNTLTNCGQDGIALSENAGGAGGSSLARNNTIGNNSITSAARDGICIGASGHPGPDNSVIGNNVSSCQNGIAVLNTSSTTISSNIVHDNSQDGILLDSSDSNKIYSNTVYSNGTTSTVLYNSTLNYVTYNGNPYKSTAGISGGVAYLVDNNYTEVYANGVYGDAYEHQSHSSILGLDGTQDLYLGLIQNPSQSDYYTFYTNQSEGDLVTWAQANINGGCPACQIDYYSLDPVWHANGAGQNYTWNSSSLPQGGTVNSYYYTSSILSVNYQGSDYNNSPFGFPGVFYLSLAGGINFLAKDLNNYALFGFDDTNNLELALIDDGGAFMGKSGWVVPEGYDVVGLFQAQLGITPTEVCRESNVFSSNGVGADYSFKPLSSWSGCSEATMSTGYANPATMIAHSAAPPSLTANKNYAGSGLSLSSASSNTLSNNNIHNNGNGITFSGTSSSNTMSSSTIVSSLGYDMVSSTSGTNILDNTSFNTASTSITSGQFNVFFDVRAFITDLSTSDPISGAACWLTDAKGNFTILGLTDPSGYTSYSSVNAFSMDSSGFQTDNNPYTLSAFKTRTGSQIVNYINSQSQTLSLSLSPLCISDPSKDPPICATCTCGYAECAPCARCIHPGATEFPNDGIDSNCNGYDNCFIATAAFGTAIGGKINVLRSFRDFYLMTNPLGRALVSSYYKYSPPIADYIAHRELLRAVVRTLLLPVVGFASLLM